MFVFGIFFIALAVNNDDGEIASTNQPSPTEFHHNGMRLAYEEMVTLEVPPTKGLIPSPNLITPEVGDQGDKAVLKEKDEMLPVIKRKNKKVWWLKNKTKKNCFFLGKKKMV